MKKLIILMLLFLTACTVNTNTTEYKKEKTFLGYITDSNNDMVLLLNTEVYLTTVDPDQKETLVSVATTKISKYHQLLDSHHKYLDSNGDEIINIAVLNESIGKGPLTVDIAIIDALKEAINLSQLTTGYFNFTLGKLSNLYSDKLLPYDSINTDPKDKDIEECMNGIIPHNKLTDYIVIDEEHNTVELKENEYPYLLDLGAFSKGFIINRVCEELKQYNTSFLLNAGASSIATYTNDKEGITWTIAVKNPESISQDLLAFTLNNGAISTSGDYEMYYFLEDGTRRHHILNPYTGYSENFYESNTLVSDNAGAIDALSTALFNVSEQSEYKSILENVGNYYNMDISYLYVQKGMNIFMNKGFNDLLSSNILLPNTHSYTSTIIEE